MTDALRDAILRGDLEPGRRLAQVELAQELGVSRIPLRDALRRLAAEGLVDIDGRRGASVSSLNPSDVDEIYEMRTMLESECARRAVDSLDEEAATHLIALSEEMDRSHDDPVIGGQARRDFYAELYAHADRPRMRSMILQLRALVQPYHVLADSDEQPHAHEELRAAIADRDGSRAADVIRRHLRAARDDLVRSLHTNESE